MLPQGEVLEQVVLPAPSAIKKSALYGNIHKRKPYQSGAHADRTETGQNTEQSTKYNKPVHNDVIPQSAWFVFSLSLPDV